jgi:hypothetical protein
MWLGCGAGCSVLGAGATPAAAQTETPQLVAREQPDLGIRGKISLTAAYGLDLDVFGEVLMPGLGETPARIIAVANAVPYPTVYVATPRRQLVTLGFGVFQRSELIARYSRTRYAAEPASIGEVVNISGRGPLVATFSTCSDTTIEGGLRHYFKATGPSRNYVNLLYGRRSIEAISARMTGNFVDSDLGAIRLYDAATIPTAAIVFGVTYERGRLGIFVEGGVRWTQKMSRQDDDLRPLGAEVINNTGARIFMPLNVGFVFRM